MPIPMTLTNLIVVYNGQRTQYPIDRHTPIAPRLLHCTRKFKNTELQTCPEQQLLTQSHCFHIGGKSDFSPSFHMTPHPHRHSSNTIPWAVPAAYQTPASWQAGQSPTQRCCTRAQTAARDCERVQATCGRPTHARGESTSACNLHTVQRHSVAPRAPSTARTTR